MKKVIKIIVALCTILMISVSACAAEISIGSINSNAYDVSVDIVLDEIPSDLLDLSAITIKYNFDDSTFEYVGVILLFFLLHYQTLLFLQLQVFQLQHLQ